MDELPAPGTTPHGSLEAQSPLLPGAKGKGSLLPPLQRADSAKQRTIQARMFPRPLPLPAPWRPQMGTQRTVWSFEPVNKLRSSSTANMIHA